MDEHRARRLSKFLSWVLRHRPDAVGLCLDAEGWVDVDAVLDAAARSGRQMSRPELEQIVATNDKRRFALSGDGARIRASQGHSIDVELGYEPKQPPEFLFHGTAARLRAVISREGLRKMNRQHVHLSVDPDKAVVVGARHGRPIVFVVAARNMHETGYAFYESANRVWLTDHVPPGYLSIDDRGS